MWRKEHTKYLVILKTEQNKIKKTRTKNSDKEDKTMYTYIFTCKIEIITLDNKH